MESEADTKADGRFSFKTLHDYVCNKQYPSAFSKGEKRALRKRAHCFDIVDGQLHYTLGVTQRMPDSDKAPDRADSPVDKISGTINLLLKRQEKAFEIAEANIKYAQTKQKETYDRKHQPPTFSVGSKVLLENTAQKQRKGGKLESRWLGPYYVNRDLGKRLYELKSEAGKIIKKKANVCRLKIYHERKHGDPDEQPPSDADKQPPSDTDKQPPSDADE